MSAISIKFAHNNATIYPSQRRRLLSTEIENVLDILVHTFEYSSTRNWRLEHITFIIRDENTFVYRLEVSIWLDFFCTLVIALRPRA